MHETGNKIGILSGIAYCVGDIVGSGIFISPTSILKHSGSVGLSLIIWSFCALISLFGALCYIELGTAIRKSGNDFAYLCHFGWKPFASAFLWVSCTLSYPATMAIQMVTLGEYISAGLSQWIHLNESCQFFLQRLIGISVIWPLLYLNFFSLRKIVGKFQIIATSAKIIVAGVIIVTGFIWLIFKGGSSHFDDSFKGSTKNAGDIVLAIYSGLFAYNGWDVLNFGAEEIENPKTTLPIAAFSGIAISAFVFICMNVAYFSVLTVAEFKSSDAVAVTFAQHALGDFQYAIPFLIGLLLIGSLNSGIFACSRYLFAGASRGVVPTAILGVHSRSNSPRVSVFIETLLAIGLMFIGNLDQIISYMSFALWSQRTITQVGFIYWKYMGRLDGPDVFSVPLFVPCVFFMISLSLLIIPIVQDFFVAIYGLALIALGFVIYFLFIFPKKLPKICYQLNENFLIFCQIIFNIIPAEKVDL